MPKVGRAAQNLNDFLELGEVYIHIQIISIDPSNIWQFSRLDE